MTGKTWTQPSRRWDDAGATVRRDQADMRWEERVGFVAAPEGNPISLSASVRPETRARRIEHYVAMLGEHKKTYP